MTAIDLREKLAAIGEELWSPKIVAALNGYHVKLARIEGVFPWHAHPETDELFLVLEGEMALEIWTGEGDPGGSAPAPGVLHPSVERVALERGHLHVVPAGVFHRPVAEVRCGILMVEPAGTTNTGTAEGGERPTTAGEWI